MLGSTEDQPDARPGCRAASRSATYRCAQRATLSGMSLDPALAEGVRASDVARLAGISYRQLDHWTRAGVLRTVGGCCPGSGFNRVYDAGEVRVAAVIGRLRALGAPSRVLAHVADVVRAMGDDEWHGTLMVSTSGRCARVRGASGTLGAACWLVNLELLALRA